MLLSHACYRSAPSFVFPTHISVVFTASFVQSHITPSALSGVFNRQCTHWMLHKWFCYTWNCQYVLNNDFYYYVAGIPENICAEHITCCYLGSVVAKMEKLSATRWRAASFFRYFHLWPEILSDACHPRIGKHFLFHFNPIVVCRSDMTWNCR